jgi:hypothetical protein
MRDIIQNLLSYVIVDADESSDGPWFYYGYRKWGDTEWVIARTDKGLYNYRYAYGTSDWETAWETRALQTYGLPPTS